MLASNQLQHFGEQDSPEEMTLVVQAQVSRPEDKNIGDQTLPHVCSLLVDHHNCLVFNVCKSRLSNFTLHFREFWVLFSVRQSYSEHI